MRKNGTKKNNLNSLMQRAKKIIKYLSEYYILYVPVCSSNAKKLLPYLQLFTFTIIYLYIRDSLTLKEKIYNFKHRVVLISNAKMIINKSNRYE